MSEDAEHRGGKLDRAQAWSALDKTLTEARSKFADMASDELESLINEAVAAARTVPRLSSSTKPTCSRNGTPWSPG